MLQIAATFNAQNSDNLSSTYTFEKGESYEWDRDPLQVRNQIFSTAASHNEVKSSDQKCKDFKNDLWAHLLILWKSSNLDFDLGQKANHQRHQI